MKIPKIINNHAKEIKNHVRDGNIEKAIKRLIDFADNYHLKSQNKTIKLSGRYNTLKQKVEKGIINHNEEEVSLNKIINAIPKIVDDIYQKIELEYHKGENRKKFNSYDDFIRSESQKLRTPDDVILEIRNVEKKYRSTNFCLQLESLCLRLGEITGLVGENATGKTTMLHIFAGDLAYDEGEINYPTFQNNKWLYWPDIKKQISLVPQEIPKWHGTLGQNLSYHAAQHGIYGLKNKREVEYIVHRLGLVNYIDNTWQELSGGYKLRFALAKALVCRPKLLIIDEPLANLDVKTQLIVLDDLRHLSKSLRNPLSIVISSQHIHEIESISDQLLFMQRGKLEIFNSNEYYRDKNQNIYEVSCSVTQPQLEKALSILPVVNVQNNSSVYIITTLKTVKSKDLLLVLNQNNIKIQYFRDISQSIKTKFL